MPGSLKAFILKQGDAWKKQYFPGLLLTLVFDFFHQRRVKSLLLLLPAFIVIGFLILPSFFLHLEQVSLEAMMMNRGTRSAGL